MPRVMIECPQTGRPVYTGINLNWETFESYRFGAQTLACPECGRDHSWSRADVQLDEAGGGD